MRYKLTAAGLMPFTAQEEADFDARLISDELASVSSRRAEKSQQFRNDAFARIAAMYGKTDPNSVAFAELNDLARAAVLLRKEAAGTATTAESAELDALDAKKASIDAIRAAQNVAETALQSAGIDTALTVAQRIAEIDAVTPVWP